MCYVMNPKLTVPIDDRHMVYEKRKYRLFASASSDRRV